MLTYEYVEARLEYSPDTGTLLWKKRPISFFSAGKQSAAHAHATWNGRHAGSVAGKTDDHGYIRIGLAGKQIRAHRIAWLIKTGKWPLYEIDHVNLVRSDNRWANLREATHQQNIVNRCAQRNNTSGFKGVTLECSSGRFIAQIGVDRRHINLGRFSTPHEAAEAYRVAAISYFGEFAKVAR